MDILHLVEHGFEGCPVPDARLGDGLGDGVWSSRKLHEAILPLGTTQAQRSCGIQLEGWVSDKKYDIEHLSVSGRGLFHRAVERGWERRLREAERLSKEQNSRTTFRGGVFEITMFSNSMMLVRLLHHHSSSQRRPESFCCSR